MTPDQIRDTITLLCCLYVLVDVSLTALNMYSIRKQRFVPDLFQDFLDHASWTKARSYSLTKCRFQVFRSLYGGALLIVLANSEFLGSGARWVASFGFPEFVSEILYVFLVLFCLWLLAMPWQAYRIFVIEERYGFNKTTVSTWIVDMLKSGCIMFVLCAPLLAGLFWFMESAGRYWWVYALVFVALFQLTILFLYPVFIAPLFNSFEPLEEGDLKSRLSSLAQRLQFQTAGIFVMDGSKRSSHGNAYFTGFGKNKRIVLFDTLLDILPDTGLAAVLAHEIGHEKLHHIKKGIVISLFTLGVGLWMISLLLEFDPLYAAFGFVQASPAAVLVIFMIFSEPLFFFLTPCTAMFSRLFEYQADRFAVDAVNGATPLQEALLLLSRESLANLAPHPWYSFFHYSHPTLLERYLAMEEYAASRS